MSVCCYGFWANRLETQDSQQNEREIETSRPEAARSMGANVRSPYVPTTTVQGLLDQYRPTDLKDSHKRVDPFETTLWKLQVKVVEITLHPDNDFYLTIEQNGIRTVAELPPPGSVEGKAFLSEMSKTRNQLEKQFSPSMKPKLIGKRAEITGLGFFGQPGLGPKGQRTNGARIYPLVSLRWLN